MDPILAAILGRALQTSQCDGRERREYSRDPCGPASCVPSAKIGCSLAPRAAKAAWLGSLQVAASGTVATAPDWPGQSECLNRDLRIPSIDNCWEQPFPQPIGEQVLPDGAGLA